jgi:hypothetical protein
MSIIGMFKRLISCASVSPVEKAQSINVHTFSESDKLVAQKCAESALEYSLSPSISQISPRT